jgi:hypothetical protein
MLNRERYDAFSLRSGTRQGCTRLPLLRIILSDVLAREIRQKSEIKFVHIGYEDTKLSLFTNDMIFSTENPKESSKELS